MFWLGIWFLFDGFFFCKFMMCCDVFETESQFEYFARIGEYVLNMRFG